MQTNWDGISSAHITAHTSFLSRPNIVPLVLFISYNDRKPAISKTANLVESLFTKTFPGLHFTNYLSSNLINGIVYLWILPDILATNKWLSFMLQAHTGSSVY